MFSRQQSRRFCRPEVSAFAAVLIALVALLAWDVPADLPRHGVVVLLAKTDHAAANWGSMQEDALVVAILHDGHIYFDLQLVSQDELTDKLKDRVRSGAPRKVYIKADARVFYKSVKDVLECVQAAGLSDIAFVTEQRRLNP